MAEEEILENAAAADSAEVPEIPDYPLNLTAEEVDAAIVRAHRIIAGKVKLAAYFNVTKGLYRASAVHDLSAYTTPVCIAAVEGGQTELPVDMSVGKSGVDFIVKTNDSAVKQRYVHYIIMEGGQ